MKKLILFTLTTILLLNCSNGANEPTEPTCQDGICLTDEQLNFFKMHLEDDTLTKKVLFEMSSMDLSSKSITSLDTGIFNNLINLTSVDLTDNPICSVDKSDVGLADGVNLNFEIGQCLTNAQLTFFNRHIMSITTKQELYEAPTLNLSSKSITSLDTGIFNNLINLTSVDLTSNTICVDKANVGLADVVTLTFDRWNCLTDEQLNFFSSHTSLDTKQKLFNATNLRLDSKDISTLPTGIFNNLTKITWLWLNENDLTSIPAEIGNLTSLRILYLDNNALTIIPDGIFDNLTSLTALELHNNKLTNIPAGIFTKLTNLTALLLKNSGPSEMNSFDCNDTNYTAWGLTVPITITSFTCS